MTYTYTYAVLEVSPQTYAEVRRLLEAADYGHAFHTDTTRGTYPEVIDMHGIALAATSGGPIALNEAQEQAVKAWAADDRLWTTQETVEFNLRTFARTVLSQLGPKGEPDAPADPTKQ